MEFNNVKGTSASAPETEVLVVGAGPTGLTLALDLRRRGVRVQVVERSARLFPGSRGKGLQPRTLEVLDDLGVLGAIRAHGGPAPVGMIWRDGCRQGEYRMFEEREPTDAEPCPGPWLVPQWRTQEILYARLRELGGEVAFGTALTALAQDPDGVTATLTATGAAPAQAAPVTGTVRARYVVAADGGRGTVRGLLGIAMAGESVDPAPFLVADLRIPSLDRLNWHLFPDGAAAPGGGARASAPGLGGSFLSLCPLPGTDEFQLTARRAAAQGAPDAPAPGTSAAAVRQLVAAGTHLAASEVTEVVWASEFRVRTALADRFGEGRVFLAGDAAHLHSPAGGQGLNTGIQDAYNLGWKLGQVVRGGAPRALLDTYEEERRPVAAGVLGLSTRIHRGEAERGAATRQLGLGYRGGPLATGAAGALTAGDRAPDGPLGGGRIFDALRGPHFTLLAVGTDAVVPPAVEEAVRVRRLDAYAPYGKGLFLVRPDGYVGWAGEDPIGLTEWLVRVGQPYTRHNVT
ncbi:FAD-dependent monooxygenase [Streptomyces sp. NPDC127033]|uniref:FAD-dependent monooxygenase n=1 Tax=Streptomyces sp. NPDC127033 TaxID=3347110 RepID=UPI0036688D02